MKQKCLVCGNGGYNEYCHKCNEVSKQKRRESTLRYSQTQKFKDTQQKYIFSKKMKNLEDDRIKEGIN
jgi:hypothetical protein